VLPVARTRCISLMADDGLTSNRAAACRIELPSATARTIRARRSRDKGSAMAEPLALAPGTVNQTNRFSATPNCSSGVDQVGTRGRPQQANPREALPPELDRTETEANAKVAESLARPRSIT
jgi:hypothetical protein